jgi:hypothetical protein
VKKKQLFLLVLLCLSVKLFASQRTLYVDNFSNILGSPSKEDKLLYFAKKNNFGTLILYQLNKVDKRFSLADPRKNNILAEFIAKAKIKFGISKVGASGEAASFFTTRIDIYNNTRNKPEEKFDIYNLEFEYWSRKASSDEGYYCENYLRENDLPCNRFGSFNYFIENLKELKRLTSKNKHAITVEAYVGFYNQNEIKEISNYCDRLLIHAFGKTPKLCFVSARKNLENLNKINSKIKTTILFSTTMKQMGYWLKFDSLQNGEKNFFKEMNKKNINLKKNLNFDGFSYHTYSFLEKSISYYSYSNN